MLKKNILQLLAFPVNLLSNRFGNALRYELDLKETNKFIAPRTNFIVDEKLVCLEKILQEFDAELEVVRDICNDIAHAQAEMANNVNNCKYLCKRFQGKFISLFYVRFIQIRDLN